LCLSFELQAEIFDKRCAFKVWIEKNKGTIRSVLHICETKEARLRAKLRFMFGNVHQRAVLDCIEKYGFDPKLPKIGNEHSLAYLSVRYVEAFTEKVCVGAIIVGV